MGKGGESSTDQLNGSSSWAARTLKPAEKLEAREDFIWDTTDEPHASRRKEIMKAHPEVKKLFGHEWKSKYLCMFLLIIPQIWLSWYTTDFGWPAYLFVAYVFGATITQSLFLAIHELAHNLFFQGTQANRLFAMVANWPIGIAYCVPFRGYHLEHHKWQGVDGIDTDIPSRFEGKYVRGPVLKAVWCCCQILTYALRPMFIKAQDFTPNHLYNWISQIAFDLVVFYFWGYKPLAYFVLCIFLAGGLHPCAGHFISEHYVFPHLDATQETYSYYGPLNWLTWNVGYHNEHHDFCNVPWSRLPALKRCAPEFYDNLAVCDSWCGVIWDYIMRQEVGPYNRMKRAVPVGDFGAAEAVLRAKVE
jgi:sphingolipid delta-4 desaturase